jgi:hypothetical protein
VAQRSWAENGVGGTVWITAVTELWRTADPQEQRLNREHDVRLTVDTVVTTAGVDEPRRYDVTVLNRDVALLEPGAHFECEVRPGDLSSLRVRLRAGASHEHFEKGRAPE